MGLFSLIKEAGEKLFGVGEAKAAEVVAKKDSTPVNVEGAVEPQFYTVVRGDTLFF